MSAPLAGAAARRIRWLLAWGVILAPGVWSAPLAGLAGAGAAQADSTLRYRAGGVEVLQRITDGDPLVAVNVYLLGGARQIDETTAGIEPFVLHASERGTKRYPGTASQDALVLTGSRIVVSTGPDWTMFGLRSLTDELEPTWEIFVERLMHPTLDSAAVEVTRGQLLTSARAREDDPETVARTLAAGLAFEAHPYRFSTSGTEASLRGLSAARMRAYWTENLVTSRMLVVVVGGAPREVVERLVASTMGTLPSGGYTWTMPDPWIASEPRIRVESRQLPTNYIVGYFGGPTADSEERDWLTLATAVLSSLVFQDIRARGLSYAAGAYEIDRGASGGAIYVSTLFPEKAMEVFKETIDALGSAQIPRSILRDFTRAWRMDYHLQNETQAEQAAFLGRSWLYRGRIETPQDYVDALLDVNSNDLRRAIVRYVQNIQYAYVGNPDEVPRDEMGVPR